MKINKIIARIGILPLIMAMMLPSIEMMGQEVIIDDGSVAILAPGTFNNPFTSTTTNNGSTAGLQIGNTITSQVSLTGNLSSYYGSISFFNGALLNFNPSNATTPAKVTIEGTSATTIFVKKGGAKTIG
ncbi:MAG: hypothetical protein WCP85_30740, partial [Mariniphaga sp.]